MLIAQSCFVVAHTLMAHYSRWIEFLGGDLRQVGMVMGFGSVVGLLLRPWMAGWIDRIGARKTWAAGFIIFGVGSFGNLGLTDVGLTIYALRTLVLLGTAIVFASSLTYIAQTAPEERRTEAIGILGIGGFLGMLLGPVLGDFFLGSDRSRESFTWLFIAAACVNVLPLILLTRLREPSHEPSTSAVRLREFASTVRRYWPGMILLVDFIFGICMTVPFVFVASFIDHRHLQIGDLSVIGLFFWCYAGLAIVLRLWLRELPNRIGPERVLTLGLMMMGIGMLSFVVVDTKSAWMIVFPALCCGSGHGLMFHTMTSLTIQPFPTAVRGTASALALVMLDLGTFVGAPVLGVIGEQLGYAALFATIAVACFLTAAVFFRNKIRALPTGVSYALDTSAPENAK